MNLNPSPLKEIKENTGSAKVLYEMLKLFAQVPKTFGCFANTKLVILFARR